MMRGGEAPISAAAVAKSSSRSASSFERTERARPVHSIMPRMMRDAEIDQQRAPGDRQRRGQRHPQRQMRDRAQHFGRALDDASIQPP